MVASRPALAAYALMAVGAMSLFAAGRAASQSEPLGFVADGGVWNKGTMQQLAAFTKTEQGAAALRRAQQECTAASLLIEPSKYVSVAAAADAAIARLHACGSVAIGPGMLPQLTPEVLGEMAGFMNDILDKGSAGAWAAEEILAKPHSDKRGDTWPPYERSPFGSRLLHALTDLAPLLRPLLGEDAAIDFISVLYARPGARNQGWHGEGRSPEVVESEDGSTSLRSLVLKVQVLLHAVTPAMGSIHFLDHFASGKFGQHIDHGEVPSKHIITPPPLPAGSVLLYVPKTMHCGGGNSESQNKVVLDIMFKAGGSGTDSGDNTPERFSRQTTRKGEEIDIYSTAWTRIWRQYVNSHPLPNDDSVSEL